MSGKVPTPRTVLKLIKRCSSRGPGTTGQTQTTQAQLSEPEAGQTEQDRRAENTTPVQRNGQKEARRTPYKAGQEQAKAGKEEVESRKPFENVSDSPPSPKIRTSFS